MIQFTTIESRQEEVQELKVSATGRIKRVRILSDITIDDVMDNLIKAEAMQVKLGTSVAPTIDRNITDYLLGQKKATI